MDPSTVDFDPVEEGTIRTFNFRAAADRLDQEMDPYEIPWQMDIRWTHGGWTEIVGLRVGQPEFRDFSVGYGTPADRAPSDDTRAMPAVTPAQLTKIAVDAERHRQDYETGQRLAMVWRDIKDGALKDIAALTELGGRRFDMLRNKHGLHDDVRLAASLYRFFQQIGSRKPTEDVAKATAVSRATAARRIKKARDAGMLGGARPGASGEFDDERGL